MNKSSSVITIVILLGAALFMVISGIAGMAVSADGELSGSSNKGDVVNVEMSFGTEACNISHMLAVIPVGKEYYYLMGNNNDLHTFLIRADKKWFDENFNASTGLCRNGKAELVGKLKSTGSDLMKYCGEINADELRELGVSVSTTLYVDTMVKSLAVKRLVAGLIILAVFGVMLALFFTANKKGNVVVLGVLSKVTGIVTLIIMVVVYYFVSMG